jgi:hypothetical protein
MYLIESLKNKGRMLGKMNIFAIVGLLIALLLGGDVRLVAHASTYSELKVDWPRPTSYWSPGESRQVKVTGYLPGGGQTDLTNTSTGTQYTIGYPNYEWDNTPFVQVIKDGLITVSPNAKDGAEAHITITNGDMYGSRWITVIVKVPLQLKDISDSYAKNAIIQLEKNRVVSGYGDGTFRPHHLVTREEFATMLLKASSNMSSPVVMTPYDNGRVDYIDNENKNTWYYLWVHNNINVPPVQMTESKANGDHDIFGIGQPMTRQDAVYSIMMAFFGGVDPKSAMPNTFQTFGDIDQI